MAKKPSPPRPGKNSNDTKKKPGSNQPQAPQGPPVHAPGNVNPMTHPGHPALQSSAGAPPAPHDPAQTGKPGDQRQVQERINFRDLQPLDQGQMMEQQGIDPYAGLKMVQGNVDQSLAQPPSSGPVPNSLVGPMVPPGVENFPDDMAHLHSLMQQGLGPGSSHQEHQMGLNAAAIARARTAAAEAQASAGQAHQQNVAHLGNLLHTMGQQGTLPHPDEVAAHVAGLQGQMQGPYAGPSDTPPGPSDPAGGPYGPDSAPPAPPMGPMAPQSAPSGPPGPPQMASSAGGPPTTPDGQIPPQVIADLLKKKRPPR